MVRFPGADLACLHQKPPCLPAVPPPPGQNLAPATLAKPTLVMVTVWVTILTFVLAEDVHPSGSFGK